MESVAIFVLGVHGSGTSAVAGVLHHLGIPMGDRLVPAAAGNPKGHFEDADLRVLLYKCREDVSAVGKVAALLDNRFGRHAIWGAKEPALIEAINQLGEFLADKKFKLICTKRDRYACAKSYQQKWPEANIEKTLENHKTLRMLRRRFLRVYDPPTLFVEFDRLTSDPEGEVKRIAEFVFDGIESNREPDLRPAIDFISPDLNHHWECSDEPQSS